jgi:hypothetical protein
MLELKRVRRVLASLLLVLFSFSLIAPALSASDADSKLPACCRRNGKHHCTLATGSGFRAAKCAAFPSINVIPASHTAGLPGLSRSTFTALIVQPANSTQLEAHSRLSYSQTGQKRGPPAFSV